MQKLTQRLFLFNYVSILLHSFCYYEKKKISQTLLPVTHLMVTPSIMQPNPAPDNTDIH